MNYFIPVIYCKLQTHSLKRILADRSCSPEDTLFS